MIVQDLALLMAGGIGVGVAIVHGVLVHRLLTRPLDALAEAAQTPRAIRRLTPLLLQFSTFNWLIGGVALIVAPLWLGLEALRVTAILVASSYLFGAIGNLWSTRRPHPGWVLYALAVGLIAFGALGRA